MGAMKMKSSALLLVLVLAMSATTEAGFDTSSITEIPQVEADALVSLYGALGGAGWTDNAEWLVTYTPSNWFGVTVASGHVDGIALSSNALNGDIAQVSGIGNLISLRALDLSDNAQLYGTLPMELMNVNLETLYLGGTNIVVPSDQDFQNWLATIDNLKLPEVRTVPVPSAVGLVACGLLCLIRRRNSQGT